jgi:hypothetical protein
MTDSGKEKVLGGLVHGKGLYGSVWDCTSVSPTGRSVQGSVLGKGGAWNFGWAARREVCAEAEWCLTYTNLVAECKLSTKCDMSVCARSERMCCKL